MAAIWGFSIYFFAIAIATTVYYFFVSNCKNFAIAGLLLCLIRPDGFFLACPLAIFLLLDKSLNKTITLKYLCTYALFLGIIYFIARYLYFGELLPLPFYVKYGWEPGKFDFLGFHLSAFFKICRHILDSSSALILILILNSLTYIISYKNNLQQLITKNIKTVGIAVTIIVICTLYSRFNLEQNIANRFFILLTLPILMLFIYTKPVICNIHNYFKTTCLIMAFIALYGKHV